MTQAKAAIIIPARYGSTRFPGKPLAMIAGQSMLSRVVDLARGVAAQYDHVSVHVTTEDQRIADHAAEIGVSCLMTGTCETGSDRVKEAAFQLDDVPDFILNLQGDAPLTPPQALHVILDAFLKDKVAADVVTPVRQLSWAALDTLRDNKKTTPFSGTTVIRKTDGEAVWFSKNIIPAVRKEDRTQDMSPIFQHVGLYGYRRSALQAFCELPTGYYESMEGLEQLRFLENNMRIQTVEMGNVAVHSGVDSPEDIARAEAFLKAQGA